MTTTAQTPAAADATPAPTRLQLAFERRPCGRCGGSGRYSYNTMSGSVCFGCNGGKEILTASGRKAAARWQAWRTLHLSVPLAEAVGIGCEIPQQFAGPSGGGQFLRWKGYPRIVAVDVERGKVAFKGRQPASPWIEYDAERGLVWACVSTETLFRGASREEIGAAFEAIRKGGGVELKEIPV